MNRLHLQTSLFQTCIRGDYKIKCEWTCWQHATRSMKVTSYIRIEEERRERESKKKRSFIADIKSY